MKLNVCKLIGTLIVKCTRPSDYIWVAASCLAFWCCTLVLGGAYLGSFTKNMIAQSRIQQREQQAYCTSFRVDQQSRALSEKHALDLVNALVSHKAGPYTCPIFFKNYRAPLARWTPWQPEATIKQWSRNFSCQHAEFCDSMYPLNETEAVAKLIYDNQHPASCASARYLVITKEWESGAGSTIHIKAYALLIAIVSGRVLIEDPSINWPKTNPQTCESRDWACYFARLTNCSLPEDWKSSSKPFVNITHQTDQYVTHVSSYKIADATGAESFYTFRPSKLAPAWQPYATKPRSWWITHATGYVMRPNERTLRATCYLWDCLFGRNKQPRRPFAAVFIRQGDKYWEAKLRNASEYFDLLRDFEARLGEPIRKVFVGSDDPGMITHVLEQYSREWDLSFIGYPRQPQGNLQWEEPKRHHSASIEVQMLLTIAENYISSTADVLGGTLSSNQCRVMDELRKLQGKARMPYLSPEPVDACLWCRRRHRKE